MQVSCSVQKDLSTLLAGLISSLAVLMDQLSLKETETQRTSEYATDASGFADDLLRALAMHLYAQPLAAVSTCKHNCHVQSSTLACGDP